MGTLRLVTDCERFERRSLGFGCGEGGGSVFAELYVAGDLVAGYHSGEDKVHFVAIGGHGAGQCHVIGIDLAMESCLEDLAFLLSGKFGSVLLQDELLLAYAANVLDGLTFQVPARFAVVPVYTGGFS